MVLSIATTHQPATDLGYLLAKNPARCHTRETTFGQVSLFFSEATESYAEATILIQVDPVRLVRKESSHLDQYVNDAPYALNSFMSVGLREICSTALAGKSKERQELADSPLPFTIKLPVLPTSGRSYARGEALVRRLFEPLGWTVTVSKIPLDTQFPEWGDSRYLDVTLEGSARLQVALQQIYVLLPVLDDDKHYWIDRAEIEKLVRSAGDWLPSHPMKNVITRRYLRKADYIRDALHRLLEEESIELAEQPEDVDSEAEKEASVQPNPEKSEKENLHQLRLQTVANRILGLGAKTVLDLGCGEGKLLRLLAKEPQLTRLVGLDVSYEVLRRLAQRMERAPSHMARKVEILHGSLTYSDKRLVGFDAAALVEVIEHLDISRLHSLERNVFALARPGHVLVTTPNREYNEIYGLESMRHEDHRFEWTRQEFQAWCDRVAETYGYSVVTEPLGPIDEALGAPSQMGVFSRAD